MPMCADAAQPRTRHPPDVDLPVETAVDVHGEAHGGRAGALGVSHQQADEGRLAHRERLAGRPSCTAPRRGAD